MEDSDSVRIARIEEGMVYLHKKTDENHKTLMSVFHPVIKRVERNTTDITNIKRDHRWMYLIVVLGVPALFSVVEFYFHYVKNL